MADVSSDVLEPTSFALHAVSIGLLNDTFSAT
jgi:hypothetical protein